MPSSNNYSFYINNSYRINVYIYNKMTFDSDLRTRTIRLIFTYKVEIIDDISCESFIFVFKRNIIASMI